MGEQRHDVSEAVHVEALSKRPTMRRARFGGPSLRLTLLDPHGEALSSQSMAVIGGILGALIGFAVGILFTEVIFANNQSWPDVVPFALATAGIFVGAALARRVRATRP